MVDPKALQHQAISFRPILPSDRQILEKIHSDVFPIRYEPEFFQNVVDGRDIISWAAVDRSRRDGLNDELIGFVTARIIMSTDSEIEDLLRVSRSEQALLYILTLGVVEEYRNRGIASALIREVIKYASNLPTCQAVYLHVISYNNPAMHLYKKLAFKCVRKLYGFYFINSQHYDAFLFVYYVNGGRSPCSPLELVNAMVTYMRSALKSVLGKRALDRSWSSLARRSSLRSKIGGQLRALISADAHMEVRYTDIDYLVFSDAASYVVSGQSPYKRTTYRYSPLLAFLLVPNSYIHPSWGKFLFSAADLLVGLLIRSILKLRKVPEDICSYSVVVWLFNPFTFTIGTRGNCEPIVCAVILWIINCLMKGKLLQAACWYGLVVHFRIYPIIYALPIILAIDPRQFQYGQKPLLSNWSSRQAQVSNTEVAKKHDMFFIMRGLLCKERVLFGLISASVFFFFTGLFFYMYKWEFLHEALLYHLTRTDPRHNFSIYFYHIYLHYEYEISVVEKLISFLPQIVVQLVLSLRFAQDLPFCLFVQTVAFVAFNKVVTAQYFVWFFCLLPLILPWCKMKMKWKGICCIFIWIGAQLHWLMWGYLLEFKGKNVFLQLWMASLVFLAANTWVLTTIIWYHEICPIFIRPEKHVYQDRKKSE
ncbi:unnamed protein product [Rhodiola kirilowii]